MDEKYDNTKPLGSYLNRGLQMQYQYVNNFAFYHLVPEPYRQYYIRFIRRYMQWYDGYVPYFHTTTSGIVSTKIGHTLLSTLAKITTGSNVMFDDEGTPDTTLIDYDGENELNSIDFVERWSSKYNLNSKIRQAVEWSLAGGDSLIKLDNVEGDLQPKVLRKDEYWFSTDFSGRICDVSMFLYERHDVSNNNKEQQFYLFEERRYNIDTGKPEYRVHVKRGTGARPTYKDFDSYDVNDVDWDQLPKKVRDDIRKQFPKVMIGEWQELPFKTLGVYLIKASPNVSFMPALPFGESILGDMMSLLATYDYMFTAQNTDMYLAKGKVLLPDLMQGKGSVNTLDETVFNQLPYVDPTKQQPISIQFDLRADEWQKTRDNLLQQFALSIGVNERTIASAIVPASEKPSAKEITSDENKTTLFVETQRTLIKPEIDKMLRDILDHYDMQDERVYVKFSKMGITNIGNIVNLVSVLRDRKLIDRQTALEMVFMDKNNKQIKEIKKRIEEENKEEQENALKQEMRNLQEEEQKNSLQGEYTIEKPDKEE